ncbi:MAG: IS1634 family transposase, partial [Actinobacteria bacterium]|nr:IS1634 family transposase [Actinomycetota bacterium]
MPVFVKTTVRKRGDKSYTYLSLVESQRSGGKMRHNTLLRLGEVSELRDSGQLDRIIAALRAHAEGEWLQATELDAEAAPGYGAIALAHTYFCRLGLDTFFSDASKAEHLADAVFVMVANRLVRPWSKRRTILEWLGEDVALPEEVVAPAPQHCYRALDTVCEVKDDLEAHLYDRLTDLTNLDLRLVCYDLTSTFWETDQRSSERFVSRRFGYSRDKRGDLPQIVIGLLVTGDGVPIAHHVFPGNTRDSVTLPTIMADYQRRFGVGRIALVADRGLITEDNLAQVGAAGFDHVLATRLHNDTDARAALEEAVSPRAHWVPVKDANSAACEVTLDGRRFIVVASQARLARDGHRHEELMARSEDRLIALAERVEQGRLSDPAKIGAAVDRVLRDSGVARCFVTTAGEGSFSWDYDQDALAYEEHLLAGRYVLSTSLSKDQASTAAVARHYRSLQNVERRFRVLKDFLALRPVYHFTESRVRGHVAICVLAATIEAVMGKDLARAGVTDPDIKNQPISPRRALAELDRIRRATIDTGDRSITLVTRRNGLQSQILTALV